jgi:hypothetical protein
MQAKFTGLVLTGIVGIASDMVTNSICKSTVVRGTYLSDMPTSTSSNHFFSIDPIYYERHEQHA